MDDKKIVIVPDHQGRAGCVTWWRLSGVMDYDRLKMEWARRDLPLADLPAPPTDAAALRRALDGYKGPRTLVRGLPGGGYAVVDEEFGADEDDPEYDVRFKVWLDMDELEMRFDREMEEAEIDRIHERFVAARRDLTHAEISPWLVRHGVKMQSVGLRDTGGIYFIPEQFAPTWSALADIVRECSASRVFEIPALMSGRAIEAIMEAVIAEAQTEVDKLTSALDTTEVGVRGLKGKAAKCEALADKLRLYEDLLGSKMGSIHERVEAIDARIADMILMAE